MKRMIFHLPYKIDYNRPSGTNIRPQKLIKTFKNIGYEVELIEGYGKERKNKIKELKKKIKSGIKYEFLYSESSTMPTLLTEKHHLPLYPFLDFNFFKFCKKNRIKIGLFYRDIYWKYDFYKKAVGKIKSKFSEIFYKYDLKKYNELLDILFLPSLKMKRKLPEIDKETISLPPGLEKRKLKRKEQFKSKLLNLLYVGGVGDEYSLEKLFQAIRNLKVNLTICARRNEWEKNYFKYEPLLISNINIIHKSGKELEKEYLKSDICLLFFPPSEYRSFAMPLKLFEYIQHKKTIIATKDTAAGDLIKRNNIGWVVDYKVEELIKLISVILKNREVLEKKEKNINEIYEEHTWQARAKKIEKELTK